MRRDELGRFSSKFMGYESPGPFIVNNNNYKKISNIIYCSCGVPFDIDESESESVRDAFETARFIYLRDYKSKEKLIKSGVKCEINVAPDLIVKLSDFFDKEDAKRKGQSILKKQNVNTAKKILCFQSKPNNKKDTELIFNELLTYKKKNDAEIILMPIGFCHGDDVYLKTLSDRSDGAFHYIDVHSIFDMISVIGSSDFFVGTSMHGNITAFSFCIPHLFGDISVEKIDGFLEVTGLSSSYKLNNWSMLNQGISIVEQINNGNFQNTVNIAKRKVDDIFSLMCSK
jgi:polysaccharide pyruvyl transferase WcaK-like protein